MYGTSCVNHFLCASLGSSLTFRTFSSGRGVLLAFCEKAAVVKTRNAKTPQVIPLTIRICSIIFTPSLSRIQKSGAGRRAGAPDFRALTGHLLSYRKFAFVLDDLAADAVLHDDLDLVIAGRHCVSREQASKRQALARVAETAPVF